MATTTIPTAHWTESLHQLADYMTRVARTVDAVKLSDLDDKSKAALTRHAPHCTEIVQRWAAQEATGYATYYIEAHDGETWRPLWYVITFGRDSRYVIVREYAGYAHRVADRQFVDYQLTDNTVRLQPVFRG